jgi:hypothetical protein
MALEALGIDPYTGTAVNTIAPIVRAFDGTQIGDSSLDNDDIFALFPLLHAGYSANDTIIQKTVAFLLSVQKVDGSWDESVDMTAAAAQALSQVRSLSGVETALTAAETYLRKSQHNDGSFGNSFSTSWTLQSMRVFGGSTPWAPSGPYATDYLASLQQPDGGLEATSSDPQTRVWATAYAIPATFGKSWADILHSYTKQDIAPLSPPVATSSAVTIARAVEPKEDVKVPLSIPVLIDNQVAAVASAPVGNLFAHFWSSITAFFSRLL